jgi:hypothetical protein
VNQLGENSWGEKQRSLNNSIILGCLQQKKSRAVSKVVSEHCLQNTHYAADKREAKAAECRQETCLWIWTAHK